MKKKYIIPTVLSIVFLSTLAFAGYGYHGSGYRGGCGYGNMSWDMEKLDGDENGVVSFEEFSKKRMEQMRSAFNSIDSNEDGKIDASEWNELKRAHGMIKDETS